MEIPALEKTTICAAEIDPATAKQWAEADGLDKVISVAQEALNESHSPQEYQNLEGNLEKVIEATSLYHQSSTFRKVFSALSQAWGGGASTSITQAESLLEEVHNKALSAEHQARIDDLVVAKETTHYGSLYSSKEVVVDQSCKLAYFHASTLPDNYYSQRSTTETFQELYHCDTLKGLNMDRGGVARRANGSCFACLSEGNKEVLDSLSTAQDFAEKGMNMLGQQPRLFLNKTTREEEAQQFMQDLTSTAGEPTSESATTAGESSSGSATFLAVNTAPIGEDTYQVSGASIGTSVAIHIDHNRMEAILLNETSEEDLKPGETLKALANASFTTTAKKGDFVVLASDGLADNLASLDLIPLIIQNSIFDQEVKRPIFDSTELPGKRDLERLGGTSDSSITPEKIVTRLTNYTQWVVKRRRIIESNVINTGLKSLLDTAKPCGRTDDAMVIAFSV